MASRFEQLKELELKANFTPSKRRYFDKLRDELEAIVGGVPLEALTKPSDAAQAGRIRAKLEEMLKFVQDREMDAEAWYSEKVTNWIKDSHLEDKLTDEWISNNIELSGDRIICKCPLKLSQTGVTYLLDNLSVRGDLYLRNCTELKRLPESLTIRGLLDMSGCRSMEYVPDNLRVRNQVCFHKGSREVVKKLRELKKCGQIGGRLYT